jgi:hypothetical protein
MHGYMNPIHHDIVANQPKEKHMRCRYRFLAIPVLSHTPTTPLNFLWDFMEPFLMANPTPILFLGDRRFFLTGLPKIKICTSEELNPYPAPIVAFHVKDWVDDWFF